MFDNKEEAEKAFNYGKSVLHFSLTFLYTLPITLWLWWWLTKYIISHHESLILIVPCPLLIILVGMAYITGKFVIQYLRRSS